MDNILNSSVNTSGCSSTVSEKRMQLSASFIRMKTALCQGFNLFSFPNINGRLKLRLVSKIESRIHFRTFQQQITEKIYLPSHVYFHHFTIRSNFRLVRNCQTKIVITYFWYRNGGFQTKKRSWSPGPVPSGLLYVCRFCHTVCHLFCSSPIPRLKIPAAL